MDVSVIVPLHNESDSVARLHRHLRAVLEAVGRDYEILMVNDGSDDGTDRRLDRLAAADPRLRAVHLLRNYGQTSAMMAGFDLARGEVVVVIDGDLQNDPDDIPRLLDKIDEGYDVVSGWRRHRRDDRLRRVWPSRVANWLISRVTGVALHDYGCSLKAYRRRVVRDLPLYGELHRFLPVFTSWRGARLAEIEVRHHPRRFGSGHYGLSRIGPVLLDLALVRFLDRHLKHPLHLFGGFGLLNLGAGLLTFALMVYYKFWGGKTFIETPLPILSALFLLMGGMAFLLGIVAEVLMRTYFEAQRKKPYVVDRTVN